MDEPFEDVEQFELPTYELSLREQFGARRWNWMIFSRESGRLLMHGHKSTRQGARYFGYRGIFELLAGSPHFARATPRPTHDAPHEQDLIARANKAIIEARRLRNDRRAITAELSRSRQALAATVANVCREGKELPAPITTDARAGKRKGQ